MPIIIDEAQQLADTRRIWQILGPWLQIENATRVTIELTTGDLPRITVEYIPGVIQAETLAILIRQFQLVEVNAIPDPEQE